MALFKDETLHKKIDELADVNITVSQMLAVHEERISKQEEIDTVLFTKIDQLRDKWTSIITVSCQEYMV